MPRSPPTGCDIFPQHSEPIRQRNKRKGQADPAPPPTARTSRNTHNRQKKQGHRIRANRSPKQPTPAKFAGVPCKSKPATKNPALRIGPGKQTRKHCLTKLQYPLSGLPQTFNKKNLELDILYPYL